MTKELNSLKDNIEKLEKLMNKLSFLSEEIEIIVKGKLCQK